MRAVHPDSGQGRVAVAVVTGAGRGIGAGIAAALSARGHHLVVTDVDAAAAQATAEALDGPATAMPLDVRDASAHRAVALAAAGLGDVTVWVNNAGVLSTAPAWEATDDEVTSTFEVNTLGTVHGSRAAVDVMRRGDILNIVSLSGLGPTPGFATYGASKAAALSYTQALDIELASARRPVRVRALCPDVVDTSLVSKVAHRPELGAAVHRHPPAVGRRGRRRRDGHARGPAGVAYRSRPGALPCSVPRRRCRGWRASLSRSWLGWESGAVCRADGRSSQ